jgi:hypothetical protein
VSVGISVAISVTADIFPKTYPQEPCQAYIKVSNADSDFGHCEKT